MFILACTKQDDYKKFTEGGEIVYPARVDLIIVQPGNKRLRLRLALGADPSVKKAKIYWSNRQDSLVLDVVHTAANDTLNVLISDLTEGVYIILKWYTYDAKGNTSCKCGNATGTVYGDDYAGALANRVVKSLVKAPNGSVVITWNAPPPEKRTIEMKYRDFNGV